VNVCLRLWLTYLLLSASCCWRFHCLQISGMSLTLTEPHRLCVFRILLGTTAAVKAFPSASTLGEVVLPPPSLATSWEVPFPRPPVEPTWTLLQAFRLQGCWVGTTTPAFSGQLVYLQFLRDCPSPTLQSSVPRPLCYLSFCCFCCLLFSLFFSLFSLGGGHSVQGAVLIWPRVVCGSTTCCIAHLVVCVSRAGRSWRLVVREPPGFSVYCGVGIRAGGVEESEFYLFLVVFLQGVSSVSLQDFTSGIMLSASSLQSPSWDP
jgi:hypothetical protein